MKHCKSMLALLLVVAMLCSSLPVASAATATLTVDSSLTGNTGAVLTASRSVTATTTATDLVSLSVSGATVTVSALPGAVGIADIVVTDGSQTVAVQVPVGYTTFVFSGTRLTVIDGSEKNYEISGINSADEEYLVGATDPTYELAVSKDADGNAVYENSSAYRLNVSIKKNRTHSCHRPCPH